MLKLLFISFIAVHLTACTIIPGMHMTPFKDESSTLMPVKENNATLLKKLKITPITAQLIIELEKDINNRSLGPNNVANLYFEYRIGSPAQHGVPEQQPYTQYRVGPRDILTITVWEHPELTIPAGEFRSAESAGNVVGEDGNIYFPYAGIVKAAGHTVEEIRAELTRRLSKYIERVQLDVRVAAYRSQRVYVVGEVNNPGIQVVKDIPLTVLEAINSAGGVTEKADQRNVTLTRDGKTYSINLLALYEGGDIRQNILLRQGDVLNVPDNEFNKVFLFGEIGSGGAGAGRTRSVPMNKGRMTLTEALNVGGSIRQTTADAARIFVFRSALGKPRIFHLDAKSPDALILADRFPLQPHDIIFIDRAEGIRWNQIIAQIAPTVALLNQFDGAFNVQPFVGQ